MHVGLIFDFQKSLHNSLQSSTTFKRLRSEIAERINELNTSNVSYSPHDNKWKVIDNLSADTNAEVNLYHPFAVLMRMDAFFSELHDSPEQLNEFIRSISSLQQLLLSCPNFQPFLAELSKNKDE
nr:hypothetical protein [Alteromonas macleodii]|tara:strand:- start:219 stop:593 length:375 start_codon:yes stop_codon:yes gene_type:complete